MDDFTATYAAKQQASETCLVLAKEPIRIDYFNRKQDYSVVIQGVADASF